MQTKSNWQSTNGNLRRFVQVTPSESDIKTILSNFRNGIIIGAANHRHNMIEVFGLQMSFVRCVRAAAVEQNIASTFRNSRLPLALVQQQNFFDIWRNPINSYKRKEGVIRHWEFLFFFYLFVGSVCVLQWLNGEKQFGKSPHQCQRSKIDGETFYFIHFLRYARRRQTRMGHRTRKCHGIIMCRKIINKKTKKLKNDIVVCVQFDCIVQTFIIARM